MHKLLQWLCIPHTAAKLWTLCILFYISGGKKFSKAQLNCYIVRCSYNFSQCQEHILMLGCVVMVIRFQNFQCSAVNTNSATPLYHFNDSSQNAYHIPYGYYCTHMWKKEMIERNSKVTYSCCALWVTLLLALTPICRSEELREMLSAGKLFLLRFAEFGVNLFSASSKYACK